MDENELSIDGVNLEGKFVVLREDAMAQAYRDITWRVVEARGGFGCSPGLRGTAVLVKHLRDGDTGRFERYQVERLATLGEVDKARRSVAGL